MADDRHVTYLTCASCLQPIAMRSGADVVTVYFEHSQDAQRRESPWCRCYHPDCAPNKQERLWMRKFDQLMGLYSEAVIRAEAAERRAEAFADAALLTGEGP